MIQELVMIDALLSNWHTIRRLLTGENSGLDEEIKPIAEMLVKATSPEQISMAIDDLLDLTEETPAGEFVQNVLAHNDISEIMPELLRSGSQTPGSEAEQKIVNQLTQSIANDLGWVLAADMGDSDVPVFFATNRKANNSNGFGSERAEELQLGLARVTIPIAKHQIGEVERPHWWSLSKSNPDKFMQLKDDLVALKEGQFADILNSKIAAMPKQEVLIFTHGYNVDFDQALFRAAQIAYDIQFDGIVLLYSWPSKGNVGGYMADSDSATLSASALTDLFGLFEGSLCKKIHLLSHSMGNRVMVSALEDHQHIKSPLGHIVMVAADIDVDIFKNVYPNIKGVGQLMTSYVSKQDRALRLSNWLRGYPRIGQFDGQVPFSIEGLETVDATAVNSSLFSLGHSYFGDKRSLLTDLGQLLDDGKSAADRTGIRLAQSGNHYEFPY